LDSRFRLQSLEFEPQGSGFGVHDSKRLLSEVRQLKRSALSERVQGLGFPVLGCRI
jgi:hypothetical protein